MSISSLSEDDGIIELPGAGEVVLSADTEKGLNRATITSIKEHVIDINTELGLAGKSLRAVAAYLYDIKQNIKPGNWKAFLESGAVNCTPKYGSDLVSAHEKWLINAEVDESLIAQLSPRSLAAMANADEKARENVYRLRRTKGNRLSESEVRRALKGNRNIKKRAKDKSVDERLSERDSLISELKAQVRLLKAENKALVDSMSKVKRNMEYH